MAEVRAVRPRGSVTRPGCCCRVIHPLFTPHTGYIVAAASHHGRPQGSTGVYQQNDYRGVRHEGPLTGRPHGMSCRLARY